MEIQIKNTMQNKVAIIIQARMNSTRLPKKVLAKLNEKSLFEFLVTRLKKSTLVNEIILATTNNSMDDPLYEKGKESRSLPHYYKTLLEEMKMMF